MNSYVDFQTPVSTTVLVAVVATIAIVLMIGRVLVGPPAELSRRSGLLVIRLVLLGLVAVLLLNPIEVTEAPGPVLRSDVFYMLDASTSMAMEDGDATRWRQALDIAGGAGEKMRRNPTADISWFRFGRRLSAIEDTAALQLGGQQESDIRPVSLDSDEELIDLVAPDDADTQMFVALRQLSSRFGREPPESIVLFSDGRARDSANLPQVVEYFRTLGVPIHVVPIGDTASGGDISIVAAVVPPRVRKQSEVQVQVFLRSYGYDGKLAELRIDAIDPRGELDRKLSQQSVQLKSGFQPVSLSFQSDMKTRDLRVTIEPLEGELSTENNSFDTEVIIDRTKIRVLYVEGSRLAFRQVRDGDVTKYIGPHSDLKKALSEDPDIECVVLSASYGSMRRIAEQGNFDGERGFPDTVAELSAFDAIILSNVARTAFSDRNIAWIEQWVSRRGAGLCMVGGQNSFASGGWKGSELEKLLPVTMSSSSDWAPGVQVSVTPDLSGKLHPIWHIVRDDQLNRSILAKFPSFSACNVGLKPKQALTTVLALGSTQGKPTPSGIIETLQGFFTNQPRVAQVDQDQQIPWMSIGAFGKGRTMAVAVPTTSQYAPDFVNSWGDGGNQYYAKFWRNIVYWLTERSSVGRRRLLASADKRYYKPGETISLRSIAYDEAANPTSDYRIVAMVEPQMSFEDLESDYSPIRWPNGIQRTSGEEGPFIAWGEELDLPKVETPDGGTSYQLQLPITESLGSASANQSVRVELTAYEDYTQVDSTSLDIQVLHDPFEQQNPFPDHDLLKRLAGETGGRVLNDEDELTEMLKEIPVAQGTPVTTKAPLWSNWWIWGAILGILTMDWLWRRSVGLA